MLGASGLSLLQPLLRILSSAHRVETAAVYAHSHDLLPRERPWDAFASRSETVPLNAVRRLAPAHGRAVAFRLPAFRRMDSMTSCR